MAPFYSLCPISCPSIRTFQEVTAFGTPPRLPSSTKKSHMYNGKSPSCLTSPNNNSTTAPRHAVKPSQTQSNLVKPKNISRPAATILQSLQERVLYILNLRCSILCCGSPLCESPRQLSSSALTVVTLLQNFLLQAMVLGNC